MRDGNPKWSARPFRDGDERGIFELWKAVYPELQHDRDKWMKWWRWMYRDNPAGPGHIWVAEHGGTIVGQYPLIFRQMKVGNDILKVSQHVDLMTHPNFRHQGIFTTLERTVLDEMRKQGVHMTICFPNVLSHPVLKKSGWFDVSTTQIMLKPLRWRNAIGLSIKNKLLSGFLAVGAVLIFNLVLNKKLRRTRKPPAIDGLTLTRVSTFDERFDKLWARISARYPISVVRNKDYLSWRFGAPGKDYLIFVAEKAHEVHGYLVLGHSMREKAKVGTIYDIVADSEGVMHCLISEAEKDCLRGGVDIIQYGLIADKTYHRVLTRNGFISLPFIKGAHLCAYSSSLSISQEFLRNPENWLVQMIDSW
jgi:GNAT superfamily N-acetyltransferase